MYEALLIAVMAIVTFLLRALPFRFFKADRPFIAYLGRVLPFAIMAMLVVYTLRDYLYTPTSAETLPALLSVLLVVLLHIWKRSSLLSIAGGTILYMFLLQSGILG